jgi:hypothetical protein
MSEEQIREFENAMDTLEFDDEEYQRTKFAGGDLDEGEESLEPEDYEEFDMEKWLVDYCGYERIMEKEYK